MMQNSGCTSSAGSQLSWCRPLGTNRKGRAVVKGRARMSVVSRVADDTPVYVGEATDIPDRFKGVLLDQFGVLHDGKKAYPGALKAVNKLAKAGRKVIILSNSSRRSSNTLPRLEKLGFDISHIAGAITSGELTFQMLQSRPDDFWKGLGRSCLHLTWGARGAVSLEGLDLQVVNDPKHADFVLAHGTEVLGRGNNQEPIPRDLDQFRALLEQAAQLKLPLIVANPDVVTVSGNSLVPMPGTFARWYKEMGGKVLLMGKPDPIIYKAAMEIMNLAPQEVLAIGDSLEHDISGASAAGIDSMFVMGGIHAEELAIIAEDSVADEAMLRGLCDSHKAYPAFVTSFLT